MKATLRNLCFGFLFLFAIASLLPQFHTSAADSIAVDVDQKVSAATVMVYIEYDAPYENRISWGTGFIVGNGLIMTNAHVVSDQTPKRIYVHNAYMPPTQAQIVSARYDSDGSGRLQASYYDVALLRFTPPSNVRLPALPFSLNARLNLDVFAYGYPGMGQPFAQSGFGNTSAPQVRQTVNGGYINDLIPANPTLIMHDALCMNGNSGGPLVNTRGEVVGMQTWSADPDANNIITSFAISSRGLVAFMQSAGVQPQIAQ